MDKELEKFLEELANNSPNADQFNDIDEENIKDVEEDLSGGKSFKKLKDEIKWEKNNDWTIRWRSNK